MVVYNTPMKTVKTMLGFLLVVLTAFTTKLGVDYFNTPNSVPQEIFSPVAEKDAPAVLGSTVAPTIPFATVIQQPTKKTTEATIAIDHLPSSVKAGDVATFTWSITSIPKTIPSTAVYFGRTSNTGVFTTAMTPDESGYTAATPEFISGSYTIPLTFIGNTKIPEPGTYFARAWALVDGKNIWSDEKSFIVDASPVHSVSITEKPDAVFAGANAAFTWDVSGPPSSAGYTAIVYSSTSYPGSLDTAAALQSTPYKTLTTEFSGGSYSVPLRFIGNAVIHEKGTYYIRALAVVGGKNIWSGESSFEVK